MRSALLDTSGSNIVLDLSRRDGDVMLWMYTACAMAKCQKRLGIFPCGIISRALYLDCLRLFQLLPQSSARLWHRQHGLLDARQGELASGG